MVEPTDKLKSVKERFEPFVWLIGSVLVPVIGGIIFTWTAFISPRIDEFSKNIKSAIEEEMQKEIKAYQGINEQNQIATKAMLDQIKHKIDDELDSTYYFTKSYWFDDQSMDQGPLNQFFYAAEKDIVLLFIWSSGRVNAKMHISINGSNDQVLENFNASAWRNVDITSYVKNSPLLTDEQYHGIGPYIYNIVITPVPNKIQIRSTESRSGSKITRKGEKDKPDLLHRGDKSESDLDVYALLIVRRSPLK